MIKLLMAAPFDSKGRFKGGIMYVAETICDQSEYLNNKKISINKFNTCRIERTISTIGSINIGNLTNFFRIYKDLPKDVSQTNCDILYYHSSIRLALLKDLLAIKRVKKNSNTKVFLHIHFAEYQNIMFNSKFMNKSMISLMNRYVDKVIFLSKITAQEFIEHGLNSNKQRTIYNFHSLKYSKKEMDQKLQKTIEKESVDILFLGSIDRRKGIIDLLDVLNNVNSDFILHICGVLNDKSIETKFYNAVKKLGGKVILHGYVTGDNKKNILLKSDILILTSYAEGLPISIIEAFAAGCTVITTNVGAIPEIISSSNGYIINPGDTIQLKKCLEEVINEKKLRLSQMKNNLDYANCFSVESFIDNICELSIEVLK